MKTTKRTEGGGRGQQQQKVGRRKREKFRIRWGGVKENKEEKKKKLKTTTTMMKEEKREEEEDPLLSAREKEKIQKRSLEWKPSWGSSPSGISRRQRPFDKVPLERACITRLLSHRARETDLQCCAKWTPMPGWKVQGLTNSGQLLNHWNTSQIRKKRSKFTVYVTYWVEEQRGKWNWMTLEGTLRSQSPFGWARGAGTTCQ